MNAKIVLANPPQTFGVRCQTVLYRLPFSVLIPYMKRIIDSKLNGWHTYAFDDILYVGQNSYVSYYIDRFVNILVLMRGLS